MLSEIGQFHWKDIFKEIFAADIMLQQFIYSTAYEVIIKVQFFLTLVVYSISDYSETYDVHKDVSQVAFCYQ